MFRNRRPAVDVTGATYRALPAHARAKVDALVASGSNPSDALTYALRVS